ncbi:hypothetical protein SUDANB105_07011 [Streptomyces sp. enrichment culture]
MTPFLVPLATAVLIVAVNTAVLTRRDRRHMTVGTGNLPPRQHRLRKPRNAQRSSSGVIDDHG